jgi:hypothetical protein
MPENLCKGKRKLKGDQKYHAEISLTQTLLD